MSVTVTETPVNIFWFRRDLRLYDNAGLHQALSDGIPVLPLFIFDRAILDQLDNKSDARVQFIHDAVSEIQRRLQTEGSTLDVRHGFPAEIFRRLLEEYSVKNVFTNHDYEPYGQERDAQVAEILRRGGVNFRSCKDHVIFEKDEIIKEDGRPYVVFTPYSKKWLSKFSEAPPAVYKPEKLSDRYVKTAPLPMPSMEDIGFKQVNGNFPAKSVSDAKLSLYAHQRDFPGLDGTSRLGVHLRFGTVSIREVVKHAAKKSAIFLNELIWREFYQMILWHFPEVGRGRAFKREYEHISWRNDEHEFGLWCEGKTGYPMVDAGMRQLNQTGYMHNRVRMVTASFLAKHLLIDWRWGEAYFAERLLDYELASNNGGWQWAAGSGCDAAPYFRIFNPALQAKRFDPGMKYITQWVPEIGTPTYPDPVVEHEFARRRCLEVYGRALSANRSS